MNESMERWLRLASSYASIAADRLTFVSEALERTAEGTIADTDTDSVMVSVDEAMRTAEGYYDALQEMFRQGAPT